VDNTTHERFIQRLIEQAKEADRPLGPMASLARQRPVNYCELTPQSQWDIDKRLGIIDWNGAWHE
jgi:hypothetical protein